MAHLGHLGPYRNFRFGLAYFRPIVEKWILGRPGSSFYGFTFIGFSWIIWAAVDISNNQNAQLVGGTFWLLDIAYNPLLDYKKTTFCILSLPKSTFSSQTPYFWGLETMGPIWDPTISMMRMSPCKSSAPTDKKRKENWLFLVWKTTVFFFCKTLGFFSFSEKSLKSKKTRVFCNKKKSDVFQTRKSQQSVF